MIIVISFGVQEDRLGLAALGALGGALLIATIGALLAKPLSAVPENTLKLVVGLMLVAFGGFWLGEGVRIEWPAGDLFLFLILGFLIVYSLVAIRAIKTVGWPIQKEEA